MKLKKNNNNNWELNTFWCYLRVIHTLKKQTAIKLHIIKIRHDKQLFLIVAVNT